MFPTAADIRVAPSHSPGNSPAPLGDHPTYDDVLDTAVEYTFPASDPIAVASCCCGIAARGTPSSSTPPRGPDHAAQP